MRTTTDVMKMTSATMTHLFRPQRSLYHLRPKGSARCVSLDGRVCGLRRFATMYCSQRDGKCDGVVEIPLILERTEKATDHIRCQRGLQSHAEVVAVS